MKNQEVLVAASVLADHLNVDTAHAAQLGLKPQNIAERLIPVTHYVTAIIDGTTIEFIKSSKDKEVGLQSFDSDKLPANKPFVLAGITGLYAKEPSTSPLTVETADYKDAAPASLVNGELKLIQGDRGTITELLHENVFNRSGAVANNLDREFKLPVMAVIKDKESLTLTSKIPDFVGSSSDAHYAKLLLRGYTVK